MYLRIFRLPLVVLIVVLLTASAGVSNDPPKNELVLNDASGQFVHLSDYRGKLVVLNFWATWCLPCTEEITRLVEAEKEYGGRGVVFIGASLDDKTTLPQVPDYLARYGVKFPIWYGANERDLIKFGLGRAIPDTVFLDIDGRIAERVLGEIRTDEIKERLDWLLGDRTGDPPEVLVNHLIR